jgi:phenylpropionate dioxygenase-like ring-hydroxylating dioxygenase large terminal subunit
LPKDARRPEGVKGYACREAYGYVFVFTGDREKADRVSFPVLPDFDSKSRRPMHFWRRVACHYSFMHENLMDMNHQFLHRGIMGTIKPSLLGFEAGDDWVEARYRFRQGAGRANHGAGFMLAGGKETNTQWTSGDLMTIRTQYPYQTLTLCRRGADSPAFSLWAAYVPYDREQKIHTSVGVLMIEKPPIPGLIHLFWPLIRRFAESVFTEDRRAVEAEQRAYDLQSGDWNQEINPVIIALREVLIRNGVGLDGEAAALHTIRKA